MELFPKPAFKKKRKELMINNANLFSSPLTLSHESSAPDETLKQGQSLSCNKGRSIEHVSETFPLLNLPGTLILYISDYFDYQSLRNYKISCKAAYELITDNMLLTASKKEGLKKITRESIDTSLYSILLKKPGDMEVFGVFMHDGNEYQTECRDIERIYSYRSSADTQLTLCCNLSDGSVAHIECFSETICSYSGFMRTNFRMSNEVSGVFKCAPDWFSLIDDLVLDVLIDLVKGFHTNTPRILISWLESSFQDEVTLREKLKTIFQHTSRRPKAPAPLS